MGNRTLFLLLAQDTSHPQLIQQTFSCFLLEIHGLDNMPQIHGPGATSSAHKKYQY